MTDQDSEIQDAEDFKSLWSEAWDEYNIALKKDEEKDEDAELDAFRQFLKLIEEIKATEKYQNEKDHWDNQMEVQVEYATRKVQQAERKPRMTGRLKDALKERKSHQEEDELDDFPNDPGSHDSQDSESDGWSNGSQDVEPLTEDTPEPSVELKPRRHDERTTVPMKKVSSLSSGREHPSPPKGRTSHNVSRHVRKTDDRRNQEQKPECRQNIRKGQTDDKLTGDDPIDTIVVRGTKGFSTDDLEMYFESRRGGKGEVTEIKPRDDDDDTAYITFSSCRDAERISEMKHTYNGKTLQVTLMKKTAELEPDSLDEDSNDDSRSSSDDEEDDEEMFVLEVKNVPESKTEEDLELFFENRKRSGGKDVEKVELNKESRVALVYFEEGDAVATVLKRAPFLLDKKRLDVAAYLPKRRSKGKSWLTGIKTKTVVIVTDTADIPDDTLEMYFESKRKSGGTIKEMKTVEGEDSVYLIYESEKEAATVAKRQHVLQKQELCTTLYQPPKPRPKYKDKIFISGLKESTTKRDLKTFLKEKAHCNPADITYGDEPGTALVTVDKSSTPVCFKSLKRVCNRRPLDGSFLEIADVAISNAILARNVAEATGIETLEMYFESKKCGNDSDMEVEIKEIEKGEFLICFSDHKVISKILKKSHRLHGNTLKLSLYSECLGTGGGQAEPSWFRIPPPFTVERLNRDKVKFLKHKRNCAERLVSDLNTAMAKHEWTSDMSVTFTCTITDETVDARRLVKKWKPDTEGIFNNFIAQLATKTFKVLKKTWKDVSKQVSLLPVGEDVAVYTDDATNTIDVVGFEDATVELSNQVEKIIQDVEEDMNRKEKEITETLHTIKPLLLRYLNAFEFPKKMKTNFPNLDIMIDISRNEVTFTGQLVDVKCAQTAMYKIINTDSKLTLSNMTQDQLDFIDSCFVTEYIEEKLKTLGKVGVWEIEKGNITFVSTSDQETNDVACIVKQSVKEQLIPLDDDMAQVTTTPAWEKMVNDLRKNREGSVTISVRKSHEIIVFGTDDVFDIVLEDLTNFLRQKTVYSKSLTFPPGINRFLAKHCDSDIKKIKDTFRDYAADIICTDEGVTIKATSDGLYKLKKEMEKLGQKIRKEEKVFDLPAVVKLFQSDKGIQAVNVIESTERCIIEQNTETEIENEDWTGELETDTLDTEGAVGPKKLATCTIGQKCIISFWHGDITDLKVDVAVNAANENLEHIGGLAKAFVTKASKMETCRIRIMKGEIAEQKDDVIVNTTSSGLDLMNGAVSKSIVSAGGKVLQEECRKHYPNGIQPGDFAVTSGGRLSCKNVYHACLPLRKSDADCKILRSLVEECLTEASQTGQRSICFPALGTGSLGYQPEEVAKIMFDTVEKFGSSNRSSLLKDVTIVLNPKDEKVKLAFENESSVNDRKHSPASTTKKRGRRSINPAGTDDTWEEVNTGNTPHVFKVGNIQLTIKKGDLTSEIVDCIVNSTNELLDLSRGAVSQAILRAGGQELMDELDLRRETMRQEGVTTTQARGLKAAHIIHVSADMFGGDWAKVIHACLNEAGKHGLKQLAFPALGTGAGSLKSGDMAAIMVQVLDQYQRSPPQSGVIDDIRVVIFQSQMLAPFIDGVQKTGSATKGFFSKIMQKTYNFITGGTSTRDVIEVSQPIQQEVKLYFFSDNAQDIKRAIDKLESRWKELLNDEKMEDPGLKNLDQSKRERLENLESLYGVKVDYQKRLGRVRIQGLSSDVIAAVKAVGKIILSTHLAVQEKEKADILSSFIQWSYIEVDSSGDSMFVPYDKILNQKIEESYQKQEPNMTFRDEEGCLYMVDFATMEEFPEDNDTDRVDVIRRDLMQGSVSQESLPPYWSSMTSESEMVQVMSGSQEYTEVETEFLKSAGGNRKVTRIDRVQTTFLWQQYVAKKRQLDAQNHGIHNEMTLWHGTACDAIASIYKNGFNRSFCGKNATVFGEGVYFAVSAAYSAQNTYSRPDSQGKKYIFRAKVLTGVFHMGKQGIRVPPSRDASKQILYDSVVDNDKSPSIFVIFNDTQAYPEYLISFT